MYFVNKDLSIYATRGDAVVLAVGANNNGVPYVFQPGEVVRFRVFEKKGCHCTVLQKDFIITDAVESVDIVLTKNETEIGEIISKPKDYWYEIELNPDYNPQTIVGYDDDGPKVFRLFPEGADVAGGEGEAPDEYVPAIGGYLPYVTEADNGKTVRVVNGKWELAEGGGGGGGNTTICTFLDAYVAWCNGEDFPIAFYGDSTFHGTNTTGNGTGGHTFCDVLKKLLTAECGNAPTIYKVAKAGQDLVYANNNFDANFGEGGIYADTKMLGIGWGINDRLRFKTYKQYKQGVYADLETLINRCFARGIQPFLVTSQATLECGVQSNYADNYPLRNSNAMNVCANGAKKELAEKYNIPLLDLNAFTELYLVNSSVPANTIISDRLHFGNVGHIFEAGYFFKEIVSRAVEVAGKDKRIISYANQHLKSAVPEDKLSHGIADFKVGANYNKGDTTNTKIMDLYVFVKDYPASITAYKNEGGATYVVVNGTTYAMGENELALGMLDLGLHHLEVYTGENEMANFNGFKINAVDALENIIAPYDGSDVVIPEPDEPDVPDVPDEPVEPETPESVLLLDATGVAGTTTLRVNTVFAPNFDAENKTSSLSGKTITKIVFPAMVKTGTMYIGKVDLNEFGTGVYTSFDVQTVTVDALENAEVVLDNFVLGAHDAIYLRMSSTTAQAKYFVSNSDPKYTLMTAEVFKNGTESVLGLPCKVYGY